MNKNYLSLGIFAGLLAIAVSLIVSVSSVLGSKRTVTVRGLCEQEVQADRAIWPISFTEGGNNLQRLAASVDEKNKVIVNWLTENGISIDDISVSAPTVEDHRTNSYEHRVFDYTMSSVITVCSSQVEEVLSLQGSQIDLISKGIAVSGSNWEHYSTFEYTSLNDIKPAMIEQATMNAREAAAKFAKDSGSKVGKILEATQGQFTISDRDSQTPYVKTVRVVTTVTYQLKK